MFSKGKLQSIATSRITFQIPVSCCPCCCFCEWPLLLLPSLRGESDNLGADWIAILVNENACVLVESLSETILQRVVHPLPQTHNHSLHDLVLGTSGATNDGHHVTWLHPAIAIFLAHSSDDVNIPCTTVACASHHETLAWLLQKAGCHHQCSRCKDTQDCHCTARLANLQCRLHLSQSRFCMHHQERDGSQNSTSAKTAAA